MFFSASIALASIVSLSQFAVNSAPVVRSPGSGRGAILHGTNGSGTCTPLAGNGVCTNTPGIQSLILNADADCAAFPEPNCGFSATQAVLEQFSDDSQDLSGKGIQSVQCFDDVGTVNGFTAGSTADIEQEAADRAAGIAINL
ncbi:hypothetical protein K438DRAFT_1762916 [Mycena galopus ATCC 62051]|nr:hypothetical protein K438DRAFT_1762916 [Mycena galopus ATCC 62051]